MDSTSPAGFSADTEILTRGQGWITFGQLTCLDEIATRSPDGQFEWQHPEHVSSRRYDGPMLHFRSQVFDLLVRPEHPLPVLQVGQNGRPDKTVPVLRAASWFCPTPSRGRWYRIPTTSAWAGRAPDAFAVPGAVPARGRHHPAQPLRIPVLTWMRFMGWFLSEGWLAARDYNAVGIAQIRENHKPDIRAVLTAMDVRWHEPTSGFQFNHGPLAQWLRTACYVDGGHRAWHKRVPRAILDYPPHLLREMFDAMMLGDGHVEKTGLRRYITTSIALADDVVEVLQKMGAQGWYHSIQPPADAGMLGGYKVGKRKVQYRVTERPGAASHVPFPAEVPYSGIVHAAVTANAVVYVRRNGRTAWSGS